MPKPTKKDEKEASIIEAIKPYLANYSDEKGPNGTDAFIAYNNLISNDHRFSHLDWQKTHALLIRKKLVSN